MNDNHPKKDKKNSDTQKTMVNQSLTGKGESHILAGFTNLLSPNHSQTSEKTELPQKKNIPQPGITIETSLFKETEEEHNFSSRYKIIAKIGSGGMGKVYQAYDNKLQRNIAIKVMSDDITAQGSKRFLREAKAMARLRHPNIICLYDIGQNKNKIFFSMELLEGGSLRQLLQKKKRLSEAHAIKIMYKILQAMAYAHGKGIIHRDLKPENIMFRENGEPVIMDFGLAKFLVSDTQLTKTGSMMGTLGYMSPEQVNGIVKEIDERTDIYSLGGIMYELLTGRLPLLADTQASLILRIFNEMPTSFKELNIHATEGLEKICLKALEKSKKDRYKTVVEMLQDLDRCQNGQPVLAGNQDNKKSVANDKTQVISNKRTPITEKGQRIEKTQEMRKPFVESKTQESRQPVNNESKKNMPTTKNKKDAPPPLLFSSKIVDKNILYSIFNTFATFFSNILQKKNRDHIQKKVVSFWKKQKKSIVQRFKGTKKK